MDVGDGRQELGPEQVNEPGPVEVALRFDHVRTEGAPGHPFAGPEGSQELRQRLGCGNHRPRHRGDGEQAVGLGQGLCVRGRQRVSAIARLLHSETCYLLKLPAIHRSSKAYASYSAARP